MSKFRVTVFKNGSTVEGKVLMVSESDDIADLRRRAAKKLYGAPLPEEVANTIDGSKIYTAEGGEIEDAAEMCPNDVLYLAVDGADFVTPSAESAPSPVINQPPPVVGGEKETTKEVAG